jgi:hypothetical protein
MATTLGTALSAVRSRLDELDGLSQSTNVAWTDAELRGWINEGCRDLSRRTHAINDRTTISVVASTAEYTGPTTALAVDIVNFTPSGGVKYQLDYQNIRNTNAMEFTSTAYRTTYFSLRGMPPSLLICLYPTPSVAGTLEVFYTRVASILSTSGSADSSNIEVPEGWEDAVYAYAEARARRKDRDPAWQEAQQEYDTKVESLMQIAGVYTHNSDTISQAHERLIPWYRDF